MRSSFLTSAAMLSMTTSLMLLCADDRPSSCALAYCILTHWMMNINKSLHSLEASGMSSTVVLQMGRPAMLCARISYRFREGSQMRQG